MFKGISSVTARTGLYTEELRKRIALTYLIAITKTNATDKFKDKLTYSFWYTGEVLSVTEQAFLSCSCKDLLSSETA